MSAGYALEQKQQEADARLIAAALELLEAQQLLIASYDAQDYMPAPIAQLAERNTRLIAAAPDLLEALQRLIPHAVYMESCSHDDDGVRRDIERARAAIARAEGAP